MAGIPANSGLAARNLKNARRSDMVDLRERWLEAAGSADGNTTAETDFRRARGGERRRRHRGMTVGG
jgi:hypothetical protein